MSTVYRSPWLLSCMGGWCALRDHCPHYHAGQEGTRPAERLCLPGHDGKSDIAVIRVTLPPERKPKLSEREVALP